jgi:YidC/Oxa1 family membrane protein insertase
VGFLGDLWGFIVAPLYLAISAILIAWHSLWGNVFGDASGWSWVLSIVGLTLVIRAALIPLFVKQIKSSRNMQLIQPKVKELQKKYGHDRERMAQETMKLYKDSGTNPFASCLPILLQMPIFFTLFSVLNNASNEKPKGILTKAQATQFGEATLPGDIKVSATFLDALGAGDYATIVLSVGLVLAMTATTFLTQRQLMSKNMPKDALTGPYAQQQKMLLYVLPVVFAVGGIAFPIGVLFYWTTSNLWTMGQQFYVIRNNPAPGTEAEKAKRERDKAKALRKGLVEPEPEPEPEPPRSTKRQQPQRQSRSQRKASAPKSPQQPSAGIPGVTPSPGTEDTSAQNGAAAHGSASDAAPTAPAKQTTPPTKGVPSKNRKKKR